MSLNQNPKRFYLLIFSGESYCTRIAAEDKLVDAIAEGIYSEPADMPAGEREVWQKLLNDDEHWSKDPIFGRTEFISHVGETDFIQINLMEHLELLGALALADHDPYPDCPAVHIISPEAARDGSQLLYREVPTKLVPAEGPKLHDVSALLEIPKDCLPLLLADKVLFAIDLDNGLNARDPHAMTYSTPENQAKIAPLLERLIAAGWSPTEDEIDMLATGEHEERDQHFAKYLDYPSLSALLDEIFDAGPVPSKQR